MADKIKEKMYPVKLPKDPNPNAQQQEFFSVNGRDFIVKRGITVEVPECIYKLMIDNEYLDEEAERYKQELEEKPKAAKV